MKAFKYPSSWAVVYVPSGILLGVKTATFFVLFLLNRRIGRIERFTKEPASQAIARSCRSSRREEFSNEKVYARALVCGVCGLLFENRRASREREHTSGVSASSGVDVPACECLSWKRCCAIPCCDKAAWKVPSAVLAYLNK